MTSKHEVFLFGKVPSQKEFLAVSVPVGLRTLLEGWLDELFASPEGSDVFPFGACKSWRFMIPSSTRLESALLGVVRASRDAVGREYPLIIGMTHALPAFDSALRAEGAGWYDRLADLADAVVDNVLPVEQIAVLLQRVPAFELNALRDGLADIYRLVSAWHSGIVGATAATLHGNRPLSELGSGVARLGMERLCQSHSLWWRPAEVAGMFDFFHVNGVPARTDFLSFGIQP